MRIEERIAARARTLVVPEDFKPVYLGDTEHGPLIGKAAVNEHGNINITIDSDRLLTHTLNTLTDLEQVKSWAINVTYRPNFSEEGTQHAGD